MTARHMTPLGKDAVLVTAAKSHRPRDQPVREDLSALRDLDVLAYSRAAEDACVKLIAALCQDGEPTVRECLAECAYEVGVSVETVKRYLLKHTARRAEFQIADGKVKLR